jgi:flagellar assembly protein FliH
LRNKVLKNGRVSIGNPMVIEVLSNDIENCEEYLVDKEELIDDIRQETESEDGAVLHDEIQPDEVPEDIIEEAKKKALQIIEDAKMQSQHILLQSNKEAEAQKEKIFEESFNKAYDEGAKKVRDEYENLICEAKKIREKAEEDYKSILSGMESDIVNMLFDMTEKILTKEISLGGDYIIELVRQGIEKCRSSENIVIRVSIHDYDKVNENKEFIMSHAKGIGMVEIKKDISLEKGSCLIETPCGAVDCSVYTKFEGIREAFQQILMGGKVLEQRLS